MAITAAELVVRVSADTTQAEQGLKKASQTVSSFGKQAAVTGGLISAGVTAPLKAVAKSALETAGDYEASMNMMQAVSGATAGQMAQIAEIAKSLGADMSLPATSAADAADAMTELAKAGLSVNDTMAAAKGVLQLAAAGNLSEAQAAEIAANALNAFGLSGDKASEVANLLAAAANASSGEVTDMADSLKMSAAVAATAGMPVEELVAAISQMANAGIKGSDAGTSIKQMLLSLQAPTDKAAGLMEELGISVYDSTGKMLPLGDIIGQFSGKLGELSQEERNAALSTIFGSDAVRAANIVLMGGVEAHEAMLDAVTREGAAADLAGARMKGFKGSIEGLKSQIETLLLDVAEPFLGILSDLIRKVADFIPKLENISPAVRNAALAFAAVFAVAGPVLVIIGLLSSAMGAISAPILLVVGAIAALAAAWASNFLGIRDITTNVFTQISGMVQTVWPVIQNIITNGFSQISNTAQTVWPTVQAVITTVIETIRSVIEGALTAINDFWNAHGEQIMDTASTIWGAVQGFIDVAVNNIRAIVETVMNMVRTFWDENGANILDAANRVWNAVKDVITWVANAIWSVISTVMTAVQKFWSEHGEAMLRIAQNSWNIIRTVIETVINVIFDIIKAVVALIRGDWEGAWDAVKDIAVVVWDGIKSVISSVMDSIRLIISTTLDIIAPIWDTVWNGIKTTAENVWKGIVDVVKTSINSIIGGINSLLSAWNGIELNIPGFDVKIPEIDVPLVGKVGGGHLGWPGITVGTPDIPLIPLLGAGGIITRPTLAMLGEAGTEAVLPLDSERMDMLAERIASAIASRPSYVINANYRYQDERSLRDDLRLIQMLGATI